jgi:hypothetical protein
MAMDRREFLKIAGLTALVGMGGKAGFELLAPGAVDAALKDVPLAAGKKWGMALDALLLDEPVMDACIEACHDHNNVPTSATQKKSQVDLERNL